MFLRGLFCWFAAYVGRCFLGGDGTQSSDSVNVMDGDSCPYLCLPLPIRHSRQGSRGCSTGLVVQGTAFCCELKLVGCGLSIGQESLSSVDRIGCLVWPCLATALSPARPGQLSLCVAQWQRRRIPVRRTIAFRGGQNSGAPTLQVRGGEGAEEAKQGARTRMRSRMPGSTIAPASASTSRSNSGGPTIRKVLKAHKKRVGNAT